MNDISVSNADRGPAGPQQLLVAIFADEARAAQVLAAARKPAAGTTLEFAESAILRREDDGRISIREINDLGTAATAGTGALVGGVLGALFGRPALGALLGGAAGAAASRAVDAGIPDARLQALADTLAPGTSAVAVVAPESAVAAVRRYLEGAGGTVSTEPITLQVTVTVPKTGIAQVDALAQQAGEAVKPYAQQAADALGGASASAEDLAQKAGDQATQAWKGLSGGKSTPAT